MWSFYKIVIKTFLEKKSSKKDFFHILQKKWYNCVNRSTNVRSLSFWMLYFIHVYDLWKLSYIMCEQTKRLKSACLTKKDFSYGLFESVYVNTILIAHGLCTFFVFSLSWKLLPRSFFANWYRIDVRKVEWGKTKWKRLIFNELLTH